MGVSLPPGFRLVLDPGVRRIDSGRVVVGGSPLRLLRLTAAGARFVDSLDAGGAVPSSSGAQALARRLLGAGIAHPRPPAMAGTIAVVIPVRDGRVPDVDGAVVVDDGSRTPIPGAIRHDRPRGPAAARNTGWRATTAPFVAFLDADCDPADDWLAVLVRHFADPQVAAVAPRVLSTGAGQIGAYEATRSPLDLGTREAPVRPRSRVPFVPTTALVVRHSVLEELDGFDERLRFGEDVDLVWRMVERGYTVRYEPATVVRHPARPTLTGWLRQRFEYGTSAAPLAARHPGALAPLAVSSWSAASWGLVAIGQPLAGAAVAGATTALLAPRLRGLDHPWQEAARLAGAGHVRAGTQIANAVRRAWWPLGLGAALVSRRARWALAVAFLPAALDPLRILDDLAYGAGVWAGCIRGRSAAALMPDLSTWPGRGQAVEMAVAAVAMSATQVSGDSTTESIFR